MAINMLFAYHTNNRLVFFCFRSDSGMLMLTWHPSHAPQRLSDDEWRLIADFAFPWTGALVCTNRRMEALLGGGRYRVETAGAGAEHLHKRGEEKKEPPPIGAENVLRWLYCGKIAVPESHHHLPAGCRGVWYSNLSSVNSGPGLPDLSNLTHLRIRVKPCGSGVCARLALHLVCRAEQRQPLLLEQLELDTPVGDFINHGCFFSRKKNDP